MCYVIHLPYKNLQGLISLRHSQLLWDTGEKVGGGGGGLSSECGARANETPTRGSISVTIKCLERGAAAWPA